MICERTWKDGNVEEYSIRSLTNGHLDIKIQNNRPYLRDKLKLKNKRLTWKLIKGAVTNVTALNDVIRMIEEKIEKEPPEINPYDRTGHR